VSRSFASLFFLGALLSAQPSASKPGKLEGLVTNSVTGEPVKKATVTVHSQKSNYEAVTDAAGHFHFENLPPGTYQAMANREGFMPASERNPWTKQFEIAEEQELKGIVVKLLPLAVVNGHVVDQDDDPLEGAQVQALRYVYDRGGRRLEAGGFANSNDLGEFQFVDLQPGRYYFRVSIPQRFQSATRIVRRTPDTAYADTYYPNASLPEQATLVQVAPGAHMTNLDFHMRKVRAFHIRGTAIDGDNGQPLRNITLRVAPVGEAPFAGLAFRPVRVLTDGTFEVRSLTSGSYQVNGFGRGSPLAAHEEVRVSDEDVDGLSLVFRKRLEIYGKVEWDGPPPEQRSGFQVMLESTKQESSASDVVNAQGAFVLQVAPGVVRFNLMRPANSYVKAIKLGDQDVSSGRIDLSQFAGGTLTILCGTDVGQLQGTVQTESGDAAVNAIITVSPRAELSDRADLFYRLNSNMDGTFSYQDLAPGDYKVLAWEAGDFSDEMLQSPEFLKRFDSRAVSVTISPGGHASVSLKVIPVAEIEAERDRLP
jgi:protocatechuate 3,4-dioxygenase beta subunit